MLSNSNRQLVMDTPNPLLERNNFEDVSAPFYYVCICMHIMYAYVYIYNLYMYICICMLSTVGTGALTCFMIIIKHVIIVLYSLY